MVTAKADFVVTRQTKSKEVDEQTAPRCKRTPAAGDSGDFWQRRKSETKITLWKMFVFIFYEFL